VAVFAFGLLHGFGFASALREVGLPQNSIPVALLFFNPGVELGRVLFILLVYAAVAGLRLLVPRIALFRTRLAWSVSAYATGSVAAYWFIERLAAFSAVP
jgi:hypothetical protein